MSTSAKNPNRPEAHQAQWNVQVVKGKVTTRCLWNACKALSVGLLLLTIGTTMAVVGYYADQLSIRSETRGNSTVKIKNESRGFHLNNLSYAGPIVMGVGGFIVVAACVMTFEARDSAAKVVPARFKPNLNSSVTGESAKTTPRASRTFQRVESKRCASVQTPGEGRCPPLCKVESIGTGSDWSPKNDFAGRKAFTAAFVQFSRELMENSTTNRNNRWRMKASEVTLNKSPSAPDLAVPNPGSPALDQNSGSSAPDRRLARGSPKPFNGPRISGTASSNLLLRPCYLQRQALSMDNPTCESYDSCTPPSIRLSRQQSKRSGGSKDSFEMELGSSAGVSGSLTSMALDLHDCHVTLKVKDESANKRSDTARRHQLLRQKPIEDDVVARCSCVPKFLCAPMLETCSVRTKSSVNLKSPSHHCSRAPGSCCCGRSPIPKITSNFRSLSFSQTTRCNVHDDGLKIFCIDDHRKPNLSTENIKVCCEEKLRCLRRHSPGVSPRHECKFQQRFEGSECFLHKTPPGRGVPRRRRENRKIEGSLSAEEECCGRSRKPEHVRSASFSPTRKPSTLRDQN